MALPAGGDFAFVLPPATAGFNNVTLSDFENESAAVFGQLIYSLTEDLQLTLGARYTWEKKTIDQFNYTTATETPGLVSREEFDALVGTFQDVIVLPDNPHTSVSGSWTDTTPMASLAWTLPEDILADSVLNQALLYVSYAEGFKAGGFGQFRRDLLSIEPENVASYEVGFKLDMFDNRMRLNGAVYLSEYDQMQLYVNRQFISADSPIPITSVGITNAGDADILGAELELSLTPVDGLYIALTAGYIDAKYNEFEDFRVEFGEIIDLDRSDEDFSYIPEQTYSLIARYDWQTSIGTITPQVSGFYKDSVFFGIDANAFDNEGAFLDSYTLWNARLTFQPEAVENLRVTAYSNNIADEHYYGTANGDATTQGSAGIVRGQPRTYGVEIYYSW